MAIKKLRDIAVITPPRPIKKGTETPFIDMAALDEGSRDVPAARIKRRAFASGSRFKDGDTLLARITPCLENGKTAKVSGLGDGVIGHGSTEFIVISEKKGEGDADFLYYLARSQEFREYAIKRMEGTSGRQRVSADAIAEYEFDCPTHEDQKSIGSLLRAFDDRIASLRDTNRIIEDMARMLFRAWFVEFEPVSAKIEGRVPESCGADVAALFPDRFVQSVLGEVPAGWSVSTIGEEVRVVGGSTPSTVEGSFWNGRHHWATPKDLSTLASPVLLDTERKITDAGLAKISSGLLPVGSVLLSSRAPIGYLVLAQIPVAINQGFIGMVCDKLLSSNYALHWAEANLENIKNRANGTTFMEISKSSFRPMPVVVPSREVMTAFDSIVSPMFERVVQNLNIARDLDSVRAELLPRLMTGELIPNNPQGITND